jgi:hypothetical protein
MNTKWTKIELVGRMNIIFLSQFIWFRCHMWAWIFPTGPTILDHCTEWFSKWGIKLAHNFDYLLLTLIGKDILATDVNATVTTGITLAFRTLQPIEIDEVGTNYRKTRIVWYTTWETSCCSTSSICRAFGL